MDRDQLFSPVVPPNGTKLKREDLKQEGSSHSQQLNNRNACQNAENKKKQLIKVGEEPVQALGKALPRLAPLAAPSRFRGLTLGGLQGGEKLFLMLVPLSPFPRHSLLQAVRRQHGASCTLGLIFLNFCL